MRDDHSFLSRELTLQYYFEDIAGELAERGVSLEHLSSLTSDLSDLRAVDPRYRYYEVLFAEDASTQDLIAALGEVAYEQAGQRSAPPVCPPEQETGYQQLRLIA